MKADMGSGNSHGSRWLWSQQPQPAPHCFHLFRFATRHQADPSFLLRAWNGVPRPVYAFFYLAQSITVLGSTMLETFFKNWVFINNLFQIHVLNMRIKMKGYVWVCLCAKETENMLVCVWQKICMCVFCKIIGSLVNFDGNANEYMHYKNMEVHQKSISKGGQISSEIQYLSNMCKALHLRPRIMPNWKRCKHHLKLEIPNNLKV